jgi:hypothetical protein
MAKNAKHFLNHFKRQRKQLYKLSINIGRNIFNNYFKYFATISFGASYYCDGDIVCSASVHCKDRLHAENKMS